MILANLCSLHHVPINLDVSHLLFITHYGEFFKALWLNELLRVLPCCHTVGNLLKQAETGGVSSHRPCRIEGL